MACGSGSSCSMCYFDLVMVIVKGYLLYCLQYCTPQYRIVIVKGYCIGSPYRYSIYIYIYKHVQYAYSVCMYVLIVLFSIQYLVLLVCCRLVILVTIILDFFLYFLLLFLSFFRWTIRNC